MVLAPPAAFCLDGLWAGPILAMVIEYGFVAGNESYFTSAVARMRKLSYKFTSELWQLCLSFLSSLIVMHKLLSCLLGCFGFVSLAPSFPSIAIAMDCSEVLDKFSAFH